LRHELSDPLRHPAQHVQGCERISGHLQRVVEPWQRIDGVEAAMKSAQEAPGGKNVTVMGGAELGRQFLAAGSR
jgi:hypothetical protein